MAENQRFTTPSFAAPDDAPLAYVTWHYVDSNGLCTRRQLDRMIIHREGSWMTVAFLYQDFDRTKEEFRPPKAALVRYRYTKNKYHKTKHFNLSLRQFNTMLAIGDKWSREADMLARLATTPPLRYERREGQT